MTARRKVILVVEDDPGTAFAVSADLRSAGYIAIIVPDGEQALHFAESLLPDLILLDLHMPVLDGATFVRRRRGRPALHDVPVLLSSSEPADAAALADDVEGLLSKPVARETLLAKVASILGAAR